MARPQNFGVASIPASRRVDEIALGVDAQAQALVIEGQIKSGLQGNTDLVVHLLPCRAQRLRRVSGFLVNENEIGRSDADIGFEPAAVAEVIFRGEGRGNDICVGHPPAPSKGPVPVTSCWVTQQMVSSEILGVKKYSAVIVGTKLSSALVCVPAGNPILSSSIDVILPSGATSVAKALIWILPSLEPAIAVPLIANAAAAAVHFNAFFKSFNPCLVSDRTPLTG